jgi:hypothetical protein
MHKQRIPIILLGFLVVQALFPSMGMHAQAQPSTGIKDVVILIHGVNSGPEEAYDKGFIQAVWPGGTAHMALIRFNWGMNIFITRVIQWELGMRFQGRVRHVDS